MKNLKLVSITLLISLLFLSCSKSDSTTASDPFGFNTPAQLEESTSYMLESSIAVMSGMIDEQTGESMIASNKSFNFMSLLIPSAVADNSCMRLVNEPCSNGLRYESYGPDGGPGCTAGSKTVTGSSTLTYSNTSCSFASTDDTIVKTNNNLVLVGPHGGQILYSSSNNGSADYMGRSYSGGTKLVRKDNSYVLSIQGEHSGLFINNAIKSSISIKTNSDITITRGLSRANRQLDGGALEVSHNISQFSMIMTPSNLRYQAGCCYPSSGTLSILFTGSKTGSYTATFMGCGSGNIVSSSGATTSFTMTYCL